MTRDGPAFDPAGTGATRAAAINPPALALTGSRSLAKCAAPQAIPPPDRTPPPAGLAP